MGIWPKKYREILAINFDKYPIQILFCLIFNLIVFLVLIAIFARTCYCYFELVLSKIFRPDIVGAAADYSYLNNWDSTWFGEMGALFEANYLCWGHFERLIFFFGDLLESMIAELRWWMRGRSSGWLLCTTGVFLGLSISRIRLKSRAASYCSRAYLDSDDYLTYLWFPLILRLSFGFDLSIKHWYFLD